jgi:hypothetical protein
MGLIIGYTYIVHRLLYKYNKLFFPDDGDPMTYYDMTMTYDFLDHFRMGGIYVFLCHWRIRNCKVCALGSCIVVVGG